MIEDKNNALREDPFNNKRTTIHLNTFPLKQAFQQDLQDTPLQIVHYVAGNVELILNEWIILVVKERTDKECHRLYIETRVLKS